MGFMPDAGGSRSWCIGIDTGGTFTDVVAWNESEARLIVGKTWTEGDPANTIARALTAVGIEPRAVLRLIYGTTLVTNALVENKLSDVAFVSTLGFGDVLRIARQNRRTIYDFGDICRVDPPVPPERCFEVRERIAFDGEVLERLDPESMEPIRRAVRDGNLAVAVCLLHSYANSDHEKQVANALGDLTDLISISSRVSGEAREYERSLVTVLNAGLLSRIAAFQSSISQVAPGMPIDLYHSAGGMISLRSVTKLPIVLALSGPAAGVEAACGVARSMGIAKAVSFDMGGTTTDVCLLTNGQPQMTSQAEVGRWTVRQPMLAVESIGAGGGSLVTFEDGRLRVGPESAGANPGPACYGRGGTKPTLTDAAALLGYLEGAATLSSELKVDRARAEAVIAPLAAAIGCSIERAALGIVDVANAEAARALRRVSIDKGVDIRDCALIAYGGAGPMFACGLASTVGVRRVIVPGASSCFSALGCLIADRSFTVQRTIHLRQSAFDNGVFANACSDLEAELNTELGTGGSVSFEYTALMHYVSQSDAIEVRFERPFSAEKLTELFRRRHQELYKFVKEDPWEIETLRVRGAVPSERVAVTWKPSASSQSLEHKPVRCWFSGGAVETPIMLRKSVLPDEPIKGPALIVDELSTIVVPPEVTVSATDEGHISLAIGRAS